MLDVPSMEGLGRIVEEDGVSLAATRYDAAWREPELAPALTGPTTLQHRARNLWIASHGLATCLTFIAL